MDSLSPTAQKFILHWGEMGNRWGINRTVGQIHALLFISEQPIAADEICELLGVARSNVSNSLKELQNWGLVKVVHVMGDRRDHFECMKEVFEMFRVIGMERKKREIDPTIALLEECINDASKKNPGEAYTRKQLEALHEFFKLGGSWFDQMSKMSPSTVIRAMKLGDKIMKFLG